MLTRQVRIEYDTTTWLKLSSRRIINSCECCYMENIFQIPATVTKISSMRNRSLRVQVDTQENLSDEQMSKLMSLMEKYGHFCFLADDRKIDTMDLINLPKLKPRDEDSKSPSLRLRNSLFVLWQQNGGKGDFEVYYYSQMDKIISAVKEKLT